MVKLLFLQSQTKGNSTMKSVKVSVIIRTLLEDGWYIARQKGSHRQFKHPTKKGITTVNGKPSDTREGKLLKSIEEQSGLVF
jgi:predicted RNA binding protein YcfA (HicA-like mRNA interferase family)